MSQRYKNRTYNRFSAALNVLVRELGAFTWRHGRVSDIGLGGISAMFDQPFTSDTRVELEFYTVDIHGEPKKRKMVGLVMWRRGRKNGIKFIVHRSSKGPSSGSGNAIKKIGKKVKKKLPSRS